MGKPAVGDELYDEKECSATTSIFHIKNKNLLLAVLAYFSEIC